MITSKDIKKIFKEKVPTSTRISVWEIHSIVESNFLLTKQDWTAHPSELKRSSTYPSWKRKVQAVLHTMKLQRSITHIEVTNEYIF